MFFIQQGALRLAVFYNAAPHLWRKEAEKMSDQDKISAAVLFADPPQQWGMRGDTFLWNEMKLEFQKIPLPLSTEEFAAIFKTFFKKFTGEPLTGACRPCVSRYDSGGMSGGQVSGAFWLNEALPLLLERLKTCSLPAASDSATDANRTLNTGVPLSGTVTPDIILQTPRLYLRRIRRSDRPAISLILQDEKVMYAWEHAFSDDEVSDWIEQNLMRYDRDGYSYWAVIEKNTDKLIGLCGLLSEKAGDEVNLGIGYIFGRKYWHRGYAFESASACVKYAFDRLGVHQVTAQIRPENLPSVRVAEKLGMTARSQFIKKYKGKDMVHVLYVLSERSKT